MVRPGYGVAFILIIISYALFFYNLKQSSDRRQLVEHSNNTIRTLGDLSTAYQDVELAMQGYILSADIAFLNEQANAEKSLDSCNTILDSIAEHSSLRSDKNLHQLKLLSRQKLTHTNNIISYYQSTGKQVTDSLRAMLTASRANMDSMHIASLNVKAVQLAALAESKKSENVVNNSTSTLALISFLIVAILGTYSLITYNKENLAKRKSESVTQLYAVELEKRLEQLAATNLELDKHRRIEKFAATGRMASTMAHEIKNPLNNIGLALDQMVEQAENGSEHAMLLDIIKRNTTRINSIVTDLLNSTRYLQLNFEPVSINEVIDQTLEEAKDRLQLQNVEVIKNYDPNICKVNIDRKKISIAFLNLIINAAEAMDGKPGRIEITTEARGKNCFITIKDNAGGIPPETLAKLFEPFTTTKAKGTGLGLTNAQNIILNHKGLINVESEYKKGSSFIIQLPFEQEI